MRDKTRHYTQVLPCINLRFLTHMREELADVPDGYGIYCHTESGTLYIIRQSAGCYTAKINDYSTSLTLTTTQAGYGVRYWYLCPHCYSRTAKLYIGQQDIACRTCWKLHYASQSENKLDRLRRNIRRQRIAIWGDYEPAANLFNQVYFFPKPKGMRWDTFECKRAQLMKDEERYWNAFYPVIDRLIGGVSKRSKTD